MSRTRSWRSSAGSGGINLEAKTEWPLVDSTGTINVEAAPARSISRADGIDDFLTGVEEFLETPFGFFCSTVDLGFAVFSFCEF